MNKIAVITIVCLWSTCSMAQKVSSAGARVSSGIKAAYNASIIYPGFRFGVEYPVRQIEMSRYKSQKPVRHFTKMRYLSAEIGFYHHPDFHDNLYLLLGWQMRKKHPRGFFTEFSPALGYSRTFLGGETYLVDDAGNISLLKYAGYNYLMVALGGGLGYTFHQNTAAYLRTSLLTMYPSNNIIYLRPTLELGMIWQPKHFLETRINLITKSKGKKT